MSHRLRVVNLGLPKSGTTTLGKALHRSGLHTVDHRLHATLTKRPDLEGRFTGHVMYEGYYRTGDPLAEFDEFDGFGEISVLHDGNPAYPQMDAGVIEAIARHHPGVKFVATWRDPVALGTSMANWNNMVARLKRNAVPGMPVGYGGEAGERQRWIEAHYKFLDLIFRGDPVYMRLDVADEAAQENLGTHIGRTIKWWGVANSNRAAHQTDETGAA